MQRMVVAVALRLRLPKYSKSPLYPMNHPLLQPKFLQYVNPRPKNVTGFVSTLVSTLTITIVEYAAKGARLMKPVLKSQSILGFSVGPIVLNV
jgi:hypothetical protein